MSNDDFTDRLRAVVERIIGAPATLHDLRRLTGGANRSTWSFDAELGAGRAPFILQLGVETVDPVAGITPEVDSDQQRVNSLEKAFQLMKLGPRQEEIARARGAVVQAQGQLDYAKSQLDATVIRAPVTGTILDRTAEKGELIRRNSPARRRAGRRGRWCRWRI